MPTVFPQSEYKRLLYGSRSDEEAMRCVERSGGQVATEPPQPQGRTLTVSWDGGVSWDVIELPAQWVGGEAAAAGAEAAKKEPRGKGRKKPG